MNDPETATHGPDPDPTTTSANSIASFAIQNVCNEMALTDTREDKLKGESMDFQHGLPFVKNMKIGKFSKN